MNSDPEVPELYEIDESGNIIEQKISGMMTPNLKTIDINLNSLPRLQYFSFRNESKIRERKWITDQHGNMYYRPVIEIKLPSIKEWFAYDDIISDIKFLFEVI